VRSYAREWSEDEELWAVTGIVHDLDFERCPDLETGHPRMAIAELERLDFPAEVVDAIAGHADYLRVPRTTQMAKTP
jgi:predicted hydrolase (HD superfamily)